MQHPALEFVVVMLVVTGAVIAAGAVASWISRHQFRSLAIWRLRWAAGEAGQSGKKREGWAAYGPAD